MGKSKNYFFSEDTSDEIQEWLGITKADILFYLACGFIFMGWIVQIKVVQWSSILIATVLCYYSSKLGIMHNPKISKFMNTVKLIGYPLFGLLLIGFAIYLATR